MCPNKDKPCPGCKTYGAEQGAADPAQMFPDPQRRNPASHLQKGPAMAATRAKDDG